MSANFRLYTRKFYPYTNYITVKQKLQRNLTINLANAKFIACFSFSLMVYLDEKILDEDCMRGEICGRELQKVMEATYRP